MFFFEFVRGNLKKSRWLGILSWLTSFFSEFIRVDHRQLTIIAWFEMGEHVHRYLRHPSAVLIDEPEQPSVEGRW